MKKMIFFNITWMERYEGLEGNGALVHGGGSYVEEHGYGHEMFNFKKIEDKVYGYVQPSGTNNLQRIGGSEDTEYIDGVLVVFTATHKGGGTHIVGWYKDARVFRNYQESDLEARRFGANIIGYYAFAAAANATLLSEDERPSFPKIPRRTKGGMGQSNVWYADTLEVIGFKKEVLQHVERHEKKKDRRRKQIVSRQVDVEKRRKVEKAAIEQVTKEYSDRNFDVISVESENLGWDLEARYKKTELKLEVKGLSGREVSVMISPNEFKHMNSLKDSYRLCVVTESLSNPNIYVFSYSLEKGKWLSEDGEVLVIDQIISARCYI